MLKISRPGFTRFIRFRRSLSCLALLGLALPITAQVTIAPDDLVKIALGNLQRVDEGRSGLVWDEASPLFKSQTTREGFASHLAEIRPPASGGRVRVWTGVNRMVFAEGNTTGLPQGVYASVDFSGRVNSEKTEKTFLEKTSFRLEPDGRWLMTGYQYKEFP